MDLCFHSAWMMDSVISVDYASHGGKWNWIELRIDPSDSLLETSL